MLDLYNIEKPSNKPLELLDNDNSPKELPLMNVGPSKKPISSIYENFADNIFTAFSTIIEALKKLGGGYTS